MKMPARTEPAWWRRKGSHLVDTPQIVDLQGPLRQKTNRERSSVVTDIDIMVWIALGYGILLLFVAYSIDYLARRAQAAHEKQQTPGFTYHEDHDAWQCPEDQWLWPQSLDSDNRVMRYRGSPTICNSCPVKDSCTSSDDGREMRRMIDVWPASESARFHRGIACAVTVLAAAWPLATAFTVEGWVDRKSTRLNSSHVAI